MKNDDHPKQEMTNYVDNCKFKKIRIKTVDEMSMI